MSRILLIEPDEENRSMVGFMLHMNNYQVVCCETLVEGINRYDVYRDTTRSFDLVLLVADSPQLEVLEQVDNDHLGRKLIIVHKNHSPAEPLSKRFSGINLCEPEKILETIELRLRTRDEFSCNAVRQGAQG